MAGSRHTEQLVEAIGHRHNSPSDAEDVSLNRLRHQGARPVAAALTVSAGLCDNSAISRSCPRRRSDSLA